MLAHITASFFSAMRTLHVDEGIHLLLVSSKLTLMTARRKSHLVLHLRCSFCLYTVQCRAGGGCIARGKQRQSSETWVGVALFSIPSLPPKFKGHFTKFIQLRGIMQLGIKKTNYMHQFWLYCTACGDYFIFGWKYFYQRSPSSVQKVLCKRNHTSNQHSQF